MRRAETADRDLRAQVRELEALVEALSEGSVDAVLSQKNVFLLRLREVEKALQESEELARKRAAEIEGIYDASPVGLCVIGTDLRFQRVNRRFAEMCAKEAQHFEGKTLEEIIPGFAAAIEPLLRRVIASRAAVSSVEIEGAADGGGARCWITALFPLTDETGEVVGVSAVMEDNTGRKRDELERLRLLNELAAERERLKGFNENLENEVLRRTQQVRGLASALTLAEQRERDRISIVLHDDLQQLLYGQLLRAKMLRKEAGRKSGGFDDLIQLIEQSTTLTRLLATELKPPALKSEGLAESMRWLCEHISEMHGIKVRFTSRDACNGIGGDRKTLLVQMVRELLFNVVKHSGSKEAAVALDRENGEAVIRIEDKGRGFDPAALDRQQAASGGFGLYSIKERLGLVDGRLLIDSKPGQGTRAEIRIAASGGDRAQ